MTLPHADIGVFDSGLGGLSVLREIQRQMPSASVLYLADTANVPYGDKPMAVVRDLALRLTEHLAEARVQLVLMASGTSTVAGLEAAHAQYPHLPILGTIVPGAQAAVLGTTGPIGVLATNATAQSRAFTHAVQAIDPARSVIEQGCPKFVPLVETGRCESAEAEAAAVEYLRPLHAAGAETIILGCTHFPFLLPSLQRAVRRSGDPAFRPRFVDPSAEVISSAASLLPDFSETNFSETNASVLFAATGDPEAFRHFASILLDTQINSVAALTL